MEEGKGSGGMSFGWLQTGLLPSRPITSNILASGQQQTTATHCRSVILVVLLLRLLLLWLHWRGRRRCSGILRSKNSEMFDENLPMSPIYIIISSSIIIDYCAKTSKGSYIKVHNSEVKNRSSQIQFSYVWNKTSRFHDIVHECLMGPHQVHAFSDLCPVQLWVVEGRVWQNSSAQS